MERLKAKAKANEANEPGLIYKRLPISGDFGTVTQALRLRNIEDHRCRAGRLPPRYRNGKIVK
jgi:hypothetical protein